MFSQHSLAKKPSGGGGSIAFREMREWEMLQKVGKALNSRKLTLDLINRILYHLKTFLEVLMAKTVT